MIDGKRVLGDIPFCYAMQEIGRPLVIVSHGFAGCKEQFWQDGRLHELAERSYCAVALDNAYHGQRTGPDFHQVLQGSIGELKLLALRQAIHQTAQDICTLIGALGDEGFGDTRRTGVIGISMGGFAAYDALVASHGGVKVCVPMISSPYWDDVPAGVLVTSDPDELLSFERYSAAYQPASRLEAFYPAALLMQVGADDVHFDVDKVQNFYQRLLPYYVAAPHHLRLVVYKKTAHEVRPEMWLQALAWLDAHL